MSVILNIYMLPPEGAAHDLVHHVVRALSRAGIVKPPFLAGGALWENAGSATGHARSPDTATTVHGLHPEVYRRFDVLDDALGALDRPAGGVVHVGVEPDHFRTDGHLDWPASLGFYRLPQGYALRIGGHDDWRPEPPRFEGRVTDWIWLQGQVRSSSAGLSGLRAAPGRARRVARRPRLR